ncbi:MAG: serine hydrolase, partial [Alphaproteobacteria bacterium]|nr:serine hydrolase [Alphaproteobacteria bacterium]
MKSNVITTTANPDLVVAEGGRTRWNTPETRRWGFHNLHRISRYGLSLRSRDVLVLRRDIDRRIAELDAVRHMTGTTIFSGLAVVRGNTLLYERYAPDFGPDRLHSIQSITKTTVNLIYGRLVEQGRIDLDAKVGDFLSEIGSGYAGASLRDVLDMNVANDYSEDYEDPSSSVFDHEMAMGWRLPGPEQAEITNRDFVRGIESDDIVNHGPEILYKSANTDVLAWIAEQLTGRPLRDHLIDIIEAAGLEHTFHVSTDREGMPILDGGASMTARDLARYGQIFVRGGVGINGEAVGSRAFIDEARTAEAKHFPAPREWLRYCLHLQTNGRWVG